MKPELISELDVIDTYPNRIQEAAIKYHEAIAMSNEGLATREISEYLNESYEKVRSWTNHGRKPTPIKALDILRKMDLLPLEKFDSDNKKHEMLVKLHAFVHGDGTLYEGQIALYGQREDLEGIEQELRYIFPEIKTYLRECGPGGIVSYGIGYLLMIYSAHLARCLIVMDAPTGDKVIQLFDFPKWLGKSSREIKRIWLEVFLGNEGTALEFDGDHRYWPLMIQTNKHIKLEKSVLNFLEGLRSTFSEFGIRSSIPKKKIEYIRGKDSKVIAGYYFNIRGDVFNINRFFEEFKFRYAKRKQVKNEKNIKRIHAFHKKYLEVINAFLVAKKLRYFGFRYKRLKEYYMNNSRINGAVAWNTFYSYSKDSGVTPRYLKEVTLHWPGKDGTVLIS
jgi:hypothetical protein